MQQDLLICRPCGIQIRVQRGVYKCPRCGMLASVWECGPVEDDNTPVDLKAVLDGIRDDLADEKKDADK